MKNVYKYFLFVLCVFTFTIFKVQADDSCTYKEQAALNKEATNVKAIYEPIYQGLPEGYTYYANGILDSNGNDVTDEFNDYLVGYYMKVTITNITENLYLTTEDELYDKNNNLVSLINANNITDGNIELNFYNIANVHTLKFDIHASTNNCSGNKLMTLSLKVPKYNEFYNYEICQGIQDYKYCQQFLDSDIKTETIIKKVNEYKENLENKPNENNKNNNILKYIIIIGSGIVAIFLIILLIKFIRRKKAL